ncbi:TadE/TadG family type IV pilus assembly protein [Myceligenerans xiligouense]|uniref:TadE-like protein n=1 Tax=Myceligenerans xiligouense TaxID=253184 RepID=A0A3N4ZKL2_9MICO|nr:TadE family protein [Myceligenerans xiligouense]RPF21465.1 TadE-like protein [Myceligenerans xiligouense]
MQRQADHARTASGNVRNRRRRHDDGSVSTELVIVLPAVIALTFLGIQAGVLFHARQVVLAAANQGALAAASEYGTAADGQAGAEAFLAQTGDSALSSWTVSADRSDEQVVIRIVAEPYSAIPFWSVSVSGQASMPTERIVPVGAAP